MDTAFDTEQPSAFKGVKRKATDMLFGILENTPAGRQRSFLTRGLQGSKTSWRPAKIHRAGAKRWLCMTDNQWAVSTCCGGWSFFKPTDSSDWQESSWASWPRVVVSSDLGSDGLCALQALEFFWKLNLDKSPDQSHGAHCDCHQALRDSEIWNLWLCLLIDFNLEFGPLQDDMRFAQIQGAMESLSGQPIHACPLFMSKVRDICQECSNAGIEFGNNPEQEAFDLVTSKDLARPIGYRCNLNRFVGSFATAKKKLGTWEQDTFRRTFMGIELDMLSGKALSEKLRLQTGEAEETKEGGQTTSNFKIGFETRSELKSCCQSLKCVGPRTILDR